ncbi:DUF397 domain-containing protein [Streptomyces sp. DSM 44915]|uniref:DUF397 domain-containing protein n=1 Tax=Streptomyces chisholmiae TaxID=3075540 RepID=A0ABU2JSJ1_9ACTN|nr:DUF397 domain-containing protein [Streptomyces sp. DSM 44915]MDT0267959.1 DUF397 domain-containing protein [Streptomyces sp. DSM 44915]
MKYNNSPHSPGALVWARSSYSGNNGNCVEVAKLSDVNRAVRDSKDQRGPMLSFSANGWSSFVAAVQRDEFPS